MKQQFFVTHRLTLLQQTDNMVDPQKANTYACYVFTKI
jgi:hypothetical protein